MVQQLGLLTFRGTPNRSRQRQRLGPPHSPAGRTTKGAVAGCARSSGDSPSLSTPIPAGGRPAQRASGVERDVRDPTGAHCQEPNPKQLRSCARYVVFCSVWTCTEFDIRFASQVTRVKGPEALFRGLAREDVLFKTPRGSGRELGSPVPGPDCSAGRHYYSESGFSTPCGLAVHASVWSRICCRLVRRYRRACPLPGPGLAR